MHQFSLFVITLCLFLTTSFNQKTLRESENALSKVDRIYYTCKIWGFLKYYHPLVGKGVFDWDEKLQKVLSSTGNIQTYTDFSSYMSRWIYNLGPLKECNSCNQKGEDEPFLENFDLSWIQSDLFSDELQKTLKNIENNRFQGNHHYIDQGKVQQFEPKNEQPDFDFNWKEEHLRLLPLFRYWNYIEYFFPYKYQTDQPWDDVLKELIPKFLEAQTQLDFHLAMLEMIVKIDDSHAGLITPILDQMPYYSYLPARFEMIENQAVITEIIDQEKAQMEDLKVGDVIKTVNGKSVNDLHDSHKKYIWGSNNSIKDRSVYHTLFMGISGSAKVTIERSGSIKTADLTLYKYSDLTYTRSISKPKWSALSDSIAYVNMGELVVGDIDAMMNELMDKTVIIFDVRNYPKGTYKAIANYLNPSKTTFAIFTRPDYSYPGKFIWSGESTCGKENEDYYRGKVILLVNEKTQSHAEFTCMCLQTAPNVLTIGSQTAGADGNVTQLQILGRLYSSISGIGVYYPDGRKTQRVGIIPDIFIKPTVEGFRAGRDEVLEKAIEVAKEEVAREIAKAELARIAMDSVMTDTLQLIEVLPIDTLKIDNGGN